MYRPSSDVVLLQVVAVNTAMSSLVKTLNVFPRERTIVTRERSKKAYGVLPYFGAKCASPLLGPSAEVLTNRH